MSWALSYALGPVFDQIQPPSPATPLSAPATFIELSGRDDNGDFYGPWWTNVREMPTPVGSFTSRGRTIGGGGGSIIRISDWSSRATNAIAQLADMPEDGYIKLLTVLDADDNVIYSHLTPEIEPYHLAYQSGGFGLDELGNAACFKGAGQPEGVADSGIYVVTVAFYDADDVLIQDDVTGVLAFAMGV